MSDPKTGKDAVRDGFGLDRAARFGLVHILTGAGAAALLIAAAEAFPAAAALSAIGWSLGVAALVLAVLPRMTGRIEISETLSAVALSVLAAGLASVTGGLSSPFLIWLFAAPVQAALSGRRSSVAVSAVVSALGLFAIGAIQIEGGLPQSVVPREVETMIAILAAAAALGAIAWSLVEAMRPVAAPETILYLADPVSDGAPDMILVLGADGRITSASAASRRLLGMEPQELEGLMPGVLVHIAEFQTLQAAFQEMHATEDLATTQVRLRRKDGTFVWAELVMRTEGQGAVACVRDVSARRAREQSMADEAAAAIEQSKSKSRFLANMSHELRTPLNAIIGFSDMIRQEVFGPVGHNRYREYAGHINASGQHLVDMISDLLDMSKIEAGKLKLALKPVDLAPVIDEAIEMMKLQADQAGVSVTTLLPRDLPAPMADRRAVKQIMLNLLSNAIKFTPAQGRVVAGARRDGINVVIEVRDTGVGIPQADLERIGKPFEQAGDPLRDMQKGTGLGLSLVAALANLHGGRMQIDSAPGDGTTVTVMLPIDQKPESSDETVVFPEKFRAGGKG
jgi:two-component system, cell cycle sensor histidine kinase DivJ